MSMLRTFAMLFLALLLSTSVRAQELQVVPPLTGHLIDQAGMLQEDERARLEAFLTEYETKTGSQIAVLTIKTTAPEQIEQYSIRVAEAWKLGRKGVDDGVLLLVAPDNTSAMRRLRIESGRGVQGVLTDAQSKRILSDVIAPYFQKEQFYDGLYAGVGAIAHLLNKEQFPAPPPQAQASYPQQESSGGSLLIPLLIFGAFILMRLFRPRQARLGRGGWSSGATGFILGSALGGLGRGGGGFGGGGFGGGGFSGGGGSFDGGGASGDW
jgi:uncharacterized protein